MTTYQWVSRPGRLPLVLAVAFVLATGACTNRDETSNVTPEGTGDRPPSLPVILPPERTSTDTNLGHPKSGAKLALKIPAEVRAKWKAAELSLVGNGKAPRTVRVPVGGNTAVGGTGLTLLVVALVPAFQSSGDAVTSASNRPDNPAVLVRLLDKDRTLTEGWVFQKYPDFNTFNSDRVQVRLAAIE